MADGTDNAASTMANNAGAATSTTPAASSTTPNTAVSAANSANSASATNASTTTPAANAGAKAASNPVESPVGKPAAANAPIPSVDVKSKGSKPAANTEQSDPSAPVTRAEMDAFYASKQAESARAVALTSHESTLATQVESVKSKATELAQALPESLREMFVNNALMLYDNERINSQYPENHPLHGEACGVLDEKGIANIIAKCEEIKTKAKAETLAKIGQGANAFRPSVAGNQAAQGSPAAANQPKQTLSEYTDSLVDKVFTSKA